MTKTVKTIPVSELTSESLIHSHDGEHLIIEFGPETSSAMPGHVLVGINPGTLYLDADGEVEVVVEDTAEETKEA